MCGPHGRMKDHNVPKKVMGKCFGGKKVCGKPRHRQDDAVWRDQCRREGGESGTNYRGPAVQERAGARMFGICFYLSR